MSENSNPPLRICGWGWCRKTFTCPSEHTAHLIIDHVRKEEPVRYGDLQKIRRAEEGEGVSFSTAGFMSFPSAGAAEDKDITNNSQDTDRSIAVASLPSPPTTTSSRSYRYGGSDDDNDSIFDDDLSDVDPHHSHSPAPIFYHSDGEGDAALDFSSRAVLLSDASQRQGTPTFASLSSPSGSPRIPPLCPSPSFSDIVAASTQRGPRRHSDSLSFSNSFSQESTSSASSSESCQMVESQLTQLDENADYNMVSQPTDLLAEESFNYSREIAWTDDQAASSLASPKTKSPSQPTPQSQQVPRSSRTYGSLTNRRPSLQVDIQNHAMSSSPLQTPSFAPASAVQRQVWYGVAPKRKKSRSSAKSPASQSGTFPFPTEVDHGSGMISQGPQASPLRDGCDDLSPQGRMYPEIPHSPYQSQDMSQYDSYPLQTQAPYQSQTFSQ